MTTPTTDHTPPCGNPYEILSIPTTATTSQIKKSFRDLSLRLHPDKRQKVNPTTDAKLDRQFIQVQEAKSFLLDAEHAAARKKYNAQLAAKKRRSEMEAERDASMDERRRRMRDRLNANISRAEKESGGGGGGGVRAADGLNVEDLKKKGAKMRENFRKRWVDEDARYEKSERKRWREEVERRQVRVKWSRQKVSHSEQTLMRLFSERFGNVEKVELIGKKDNAALITFQSESSCKPCVEGYLESDEMRAFFVGKRKDEEHLTSSSEPPVAGLDDAWKDRESVEERKLRQAAERESILRQMENEDKYGEESSATTAPHNQARCRTENDTTVKKNFLFPPQFPPQARDKSGQKLTAFERLEEMETLILKDHLSPIILRKIQVKAR